jgi:nucleotide-binding universal stress UspA family protein
VTVVFVALWLSIALACAVVMGRRGHAGFTWGVLGLFLGPLVIPLAIVEIRRERPTAEVVAAGSPGTGPIDVLVGVDGSLDSAAALDEVVRLFGSRIGRLALAHVEDFDDTDGVATQRGLRDAARAELDRMAAAVAGRPGSPPQTWLLAGRPAEALQQHAAAEGFDILAVGRRGRGASRRLLGSVASRLAEGGPVPTLIVTPAVRGDAPGRAA